MRRRKLLRTICIEEAGGSLFLVSMLLLLGLLLAAGVISLANASYRTTIHSIDAAKARYIAEAGIYRTIAQIADNPEWKDGYPPTPFAEGTFLVNVTVQDVQTTGDTPRAARDMPPAASEPANSKPKQPARIFHLHSEGRITTRATSIIEVSYRSDTGEILSWSE